MKGGREEQKKKLRRKADELIEQLLDWEEHHPQPTLTELEDEILQLRKGLGQEMIQTVLEEQENGEPVPGPKCERCGKEMRYKGQKETKVMTRVGEVELERGYYYCPECQQGIFPPGSTASSAGSELE